MNARLVVTLSNGSRYYSTPGNWRYAQEWLQPIAPAAAAPIPMWTSSPAAPPIPAELPAAKPEANPQLAAAQRIADQTAAHVAAGTLGTTPRRKRGSEKITSSPAAKPEAITPPVVCHPETNKLTLAECRTCGSVHPLTDGQLPPHNAIGQTRCPGEPTDYTGRPDPATAAARLAEVVAARQQRQPAKPARKPRNEWRQVQSIERNQA